MLAVGFLAKKKFLLRGTICYYLWYYLSGLFIYLFIFNVGLWPKNIWWMFQHDLVLLDICCLFCFLLAGYQPELSGLSLDILCMSTCCVFTLLFMKLYEDLWNLHNPKAHHALFVLSMKHVWSFVFAQNNAKGRIYWIFVLRHAATHCTMLWHKQNAQDA